MPNRTPIAPTLACLTLLLIAPAAAKEEPNWADPAVAVKESNEQWGFTALANVNKKTGLPKKVAVGSFQVQFTMRTQDSDSAGSHFWVEFDDAAYQAITDALYEEFVLSLQEQGYEVASKDAVLGADGYALLEGDFEHQEKGKKERYAATGMKLHKTIVGGGLGVKNQQTIAKLNADLGTDSVLLVRANLGVVDIDKIKGVKKSKGVYLCLCNVKSNAGLSGAYGSVDEYPGLMVTWMHGVNEAGKMPGKDGRTIYTPVAISSMGFDGSLPFLETGGKIVTVEKRSLFGTTYGADADVLVDSSLLLFREGLYFSWAQWNADLEKKKKKI
jgi:hypothetical protein